MGRPPQDPDERDLHVLDLNTVERRRRERVQMLVAVAAVNRHLLDLIYERARAGATDLPLSKRLQPRLAGLKENDRRRLAGCGVLLVDAGFTDAKRWAALLYRAGPVPPPSSAWLPDEWAYALSHSTLLSAWYALQSHVGRARFLFGVSAECAAALMCHDPGSLAEFTRTQPHQVLPRWHEHTERWEELLDLATVGDAAAAWLALRCWQLSGLGCEACARRE